MAPGEATSAEVKSVTPLEAAPFGSKSTMMNRNRSVVVVLLRSQRFALGAEMVWAVA